MAALLPARLGAFRIARMILGTIEATKVLALERSFARVTFVMRATGTKDTCTRG
jgi:hypothetical protein